MKANLIEMEGFLRGKCLPGDMLVNETNAQYLVRKFAEAEGKCAALAAEVEAVKSAHQDAVDTIMYTSKRTGVLYTEKTIQMSCKTPETDAFLAEVRAQGVDSAIEHLTKKFEGTGQIGVPVMALEWKAQEIRQEAAQ